MLLCRHNEFIVSFNLLNFDGTTLQPIKETLHLGNIIGLNNFGHCSYYVKYQLFTSYCTFFMEVHCGIWPTNICLGFT